MKQQIHHIEIESFLKTSGTGTITFEQSLERLRALCEIWKKNKAQSILVDLRDRKIEMPSTELKHFMEVVQETGIGQTNKVALLYRHREQFDPPVFLEFLAAKMDLKVKAFEDYEAAISWLVSDVTLLAERTHQ